MYICIPKNVKRKRQTINVINWMKPSIRIQAVYEVVYNLRGSSEHQNEQLCITTFVNIHFDFASLRELMFPLNPREIEICVLCVCENC